MATILTKAIISDASSKVDAYVTSANALYSELDGVITNLIANNFSGDAADGFLAFFNDKVKPALTTNLTDPSSSLTAGVKNMLDSIQEQLLNTVDPQLGTNNRNPGGAE